MASSTACHRKDPSTPATDMMVTSAENIFAEELPLGATKADIDLTAKSVLHTVSELTTQNRLCLVSTSTECGWKASPSLLNHMNKKNPRAPVDESQRIHKASRSSGSIASSNWK